MHPHTYTHTYTHTAVVGHVKLQEMGSPSFSSYSSLLLVFVLSLLITMSSVSSFVYVHIPGHRHTHTRTQAQTQALPHWRGPSPSITSPRTLSCCAVRSGAGVGIGQEEQEEEDELSINLFDFPPAGIDIFKLEKEEIVALAKVFWKQRAEMQRLFWKQRAEIEKERAEKEKERAEKEKERAEKQGLFWKGRAETEKERAEKEKERRLRVEDSLRAEKTKALQDAAGLHVRGLLETAERDIKKRNQDETGKVGKGRRDWWMTFARDTEKGQSFVACLRRKELLEDVEDAQVASVVAETMVGIFKRINTLMHPPVRGLAAVSIVEGPLTPKECLYLECIASELEDINVEIVWKQEKKRGDEGELE